MQLQEVSCVRQSRAQVHQETTGAAAQDSWSQLRPDMARHGHSNGHTTVHPVRTARAPEQETSEWRTPPEQEQTSRMAGAITGAEGTQPPQWELHSCMTAALQEPYHTSLGKACGNMGAAGQKDGRSHQWTTSAEYISGLHQRTTSVDYKKTGSITHKPWESLWKHGNCMGSTMAGAINTQQHDVCLNMTKTSRLSPLAQ